MNTQKIPQAEKKRLINLAEEKVKSFKIEELKKLGLLPSNGLFFLSIQYPPRTMYQSCNANEIFANFNYNDKEPLAIYIHIPFCLAKCAYCQFAISLDNSPTDIDYYLTKLEGEMDLWKRRLRADTISPKLIYIGGGTPTILSAAQLDRLFKLLRTKFDLSNCGDISVEAEPMTLLGKSGIEKLKTLKETA